jgi:heme-degrading monooxygenase HmoA
MIVVLIRRFVRRDREKEFLARFQTEKPLNDNHFKGEILLRVNDDPTLPEALRSWKVGEPNCITYINVAKWDSWEAFAKHFRVDPAQNPSSNYDRQIETAARQASVLAAVDDDVDLEHAEIIFRKTSGRA